MINGVKLLIPDFLGAGNGVRLGLYQVYFSHAWLQNLSPSHILFVWNLL